MVDILRFLPAFSPDMRAYKGAAYRMRAKKKLDKATTLIMKALGRRSKVITTAIMRKELDPRIKAMIEHMEKSFQELTDVCKILPKTPGRPKR